MIASRPSYRAVIYAGTLATGLTGLIYQVIWQKYLTFAVGSDSRSVSLVVAVFLAGLAAGYRFWGGLSERRPDRRVLLRIYGGIEIGIGLYALLFLPWLSVLRRVTATLPVALPTDIAITVAALAFPTFLMGATIPLLVRVVPEHPDEVHLCHARIYGINTLGACLGCFGSSFLLIPRFGLPATLIGAAALNLVVGIVFLVNPLTRTLAEQRDIPAIPNRFPGGAIYFYTLVTGTVTLSLEVLLIRVLHLTLGAGPHNFALVVGTFILGLALGSLLIGERMLSVRVLFRALTFLLAYLVFLFYTVPFWPYWLSSFRVTLRSIAVNYDVFLVGTTAFLWVLLLPFLIPLGFMLPLAYALLPKTTSDYARKCGWLYFYNTLGTALGAVALSYVALHFLDLDAVFKIDVLLLGALAVVLFIADGRRVLSAAVGVALVAFLFAPGWVRTSHEVGLFNAREARDFHFSGLWRAPRLLSRADTVYFEDGPDTTVAVLAAEAGAGAPRARVATERPAGLALFNNGRSEGDSVDDYSTMVLAAALPYFHAPDRDDLHAAIIGLGAGFTAGFLGLAEDIERTTVVEISPTLIEAARRFDEVNFGLGDNASVEVVAMDGFRYFARVHDALDIVVSEPSVPWVVGVENLFTPEYYEMASGALRTDGVFMQWFPLYQLTPDLFRIVLANLVDAFPHLRMFWISEVELGVVASHAPIDDSALARRLAEPGLRTAFERLQFVDPDQVAPLHVFDTPQLRYLVAQGPSEQHTLAHPRLSYVSDRVRFVGGVVNHEAFLDPRLLRITRFRPRNARAMARLVENYPSGLPCVEPYGGVQLFCERLTTLVGAHRVFGAAGAPATERLRAYRELRFRGAIDADPGFLHAMADHASSSAAAAESVLVAMATDGRWEDAFETLARFTDAGLFAGGEAERLRERLATDRRAYDEFLREYERVASASAWATRAGSSAASSAPATATP